MDNLENDPAKDPIWQESREHAGVCGDHGTIFAEEGAAERESRLTQIRNDYRWTPACQRAFLEELSCCGSVTLAAREVGKNPRSAYMLCCRREGSAFQLGWDAAILVSRRVVAGTLMDRAIHGYEEISIKDDDGRTTRGKFDNRLSIGLLNRLDRLAEKAAIARSHDAQVQIVVQDFWAFLDLIERGGTGAAAALFVNARSADDPGPLDSAIACELAQISADEEEAREAEAQPEPEPELLDLDPEEAAATLSVWWCEHADAWRTNFPVPPGEEAEDEECGSFGDPNYSRALGIDEEEAFLAALARARQPWIDAGLKAREAWFGTAEAA